MAMPSSPNARLFYRAAKERFEDAEFLLDVERTTAAVYLAGYGVECILKALILSQVPRAKEHELLGRFRSAQAHDYGWLKGIYAESGGPALPRELTPHFSRVSPWSTAMRYSPRAITQGNAKEFLQSSREILIWAERRLT